MLKLLLNGDTSRYFKTERIECLPVLSLSLDKDQI